MRFPEGTRLREVVVGFEVCWGFPQVAGAIDRTHIPIISPRENPSDYYNRKGFYSIIMQAIADFFWILTLDGLVKCMMPEYFQILLCTAREEKEHCCLFGKSKSMELRYNKFIFVSDSTTDTWRSSLPYTTMVDETVCYHPQHDYRTKTVQLPSKQSLNASRECLWLIKRTMEMSTEANEFCAGECSQCCGCMCGST